ncbi:TetR/AcrR family transcriptional regulator, partial [Delftia tsuruhatensis]
MAGRPREFDRDQALERAMLAFWRRGYEGTSMADLVQALGIASARIYAAFGSKQDLFREAVQHYEAGDGGFA